MSIVFTTLLRALSIKDNKKHRILNELNKEIALISFFFLFITYLIHDSKFAERKMKTYINSILGPILAVSNNKHLDIKYLLYHIELVWNIYSLPPYVNKSDSASWHFLNQSKNLEKQKTVHLLYSDEAKLWKLGSIYSEPRTQI